MQTYKVTVDRFGSFEVDERYVHSLVTLLAAMAGELVTVPVHLTSKGYKTIHVIKIIREYTGLSLRDAKHLVVDRLDASGSQLIGIFPIDKAQKIKKAIEEAGGKVRLPSALELLAREAD